jgi:predicted transcriptional regulator
MAEETTKISFMTAPEKRACLDKIADAYGKNLSAIINEAIDNYIDQHDWQISHTGEKTEAAQSGDFATD